jgi:hypothetical protein
MLTAQRFFTLIVEVDYLTQQVRLWIIGDFAVQVFAGDAVADY